MSRETGWYKVKPFHDQWTFAFWHGDYWTTNAARGRYQDDTLEVIGSLANPVPADESKSEIVIQAKGGRNDSPRWSTYCSNIKDIKSAIDGAGDFNTHNEGHHFRAAIITTEVRVISGKVE